MLTFTFDLSTPNVNLCLKFILEMWTYICYLKTCKFTSPKSTSDISQT